MADPPILLRRGGVRVTIGRSATVQLPPRAYRGRLTGMLFETDKTFLLPSAMEGIRGIKRFYDDHPGVKVLVVGHTDTVGGDGYNVTLSVERAKAIAAFLRDDVDEWLTRYQAGRPAGDPWGAVEDGHMLGALGFAGVRDFQRARGLADDGIAGPVTRRALVTEYMAQDETSLPAGTELQVHGCGFRHPEIPTPPNTPEERNRRTEVFFFEGPVTPPPRSPCPAGGCPEHPRWVAQLVETFDLRNPPPPPPDSGQLFMQLFEEMGVTPLAGRGYELRARSGERRFTGTLDAGGRLRHTGVPADDYVLSVDGMAERAVALVLELDDEEPQVRFMEG